MLRSAPLHSPQSLPRQCPVVRQSPRQRRPTPPRRLCAANDDLITRIATFLFGKERVEDPAPAGLTRMTVEDWPDQYPPVVDSCAEPVEGDEGEVARLRPLLKQTQLEFQQLVLVYDAERDGWSAGDFHSALDGMGAAVLVCETAGGAVCGGYNPKGWLGYGDWRDAISAFLFTWASVDQPVEKLPKIGGSGMAIIDEQGQGPQFGPEGLKISIEQRIARSRLGTYYSRRRDSSRSLFGRGEEGGSAQIVALRAYVGLGVTRKAAEYKPSMLQWQPGELEALRERDGVKGDNGAG